MKTIAISSIFVLFAFVVGIAATAPTAFADHATASVSIASGSSVPGCEETKECYIPYTVTIDPGGDEVMVTITDLTTDDGIQVDLEFNQVHVHYEITATQNGNVVLQETGHAHTDMMGHHMIPVAASDDNPVDIQVVSLGIGLPGEEANWSGPIDEIVATKQVVPEFGTIAMMILGISIVSIIAVTAKTRVIPKL